MRWLLLLSLAGCTTGSSSGDCVVGVGEDCQGDDSTVSSSWHSYIDPTAVAADTRALVVLVETETGKPDELSMVSVDTWSRDTSSLIHLGPGRRPSLAGRPDHPYLMWSSQQAEQYGALLDPSGQVGTPLDLGTAYVRVNAVGSRFLVTYFGRPATARWIDADGSVSEPFELTTSADDGLAVAASATTVGLAYRRDDTLYARTLDENGAGPERRISQTSSTSFSVAVVGRTMYIAYQGTFDGTGGAHVIRIDPYGAIVDHVIPRESPASISLIAATQRLFAIVPHDYGNATSSYAYEIALDGSLILPGQDLSPGFGSPRVSTIDNDLLLLDDADGAVTMTVLDGNPYGPIVIAEGYEVGGCSASTGQGWLVLVALAGLSRCLRRPSRSRG